MHFRQSFIKSVLQFNIEKKYFHLIYVGEEKFLNVIIVSGLISYSSVCVIDFNLVLSGGR